MMTKVYIAATINLGDDVDVQYMTDILDTIKKMMKVYIPVEIAITPDTDEENDHKENRTSYKKYYDKKVN